MPSTDPPTPPSAPVAPEPYQGGREEWDSSLASLDGATFCHLWDWGEIFRYVLGHTPHRWVTRAPGGRIRGLPPTV